MVTRYARMDQKASPNWGRRGMDNQNNISKLGGTCREQSSHVRAHPISSICEGAAHVHADLKSGLRFSHVPLIPFTDPRASAPPPPRGCPWSAEQQIGRLRPCFRQREARQLVVRDPSGQATPSSAAASPATHFQARGTAPVGAADPPARAGSGTAPAGAEFRPAPRYPSTRTGREGDRRGEPHRRTIRGRRSGSDPDGVGKAAWRASSCRPDGHPAAPRQDCFSGGAARPSEAHPDESLDQSSMKIG